MGDALGFVVLVLVFATLAIAGRWSRTVRLLVTGIDDDGQGVE